MPEPDLAERFRQTLVGRQPKTADAYLSTVQDFMAWTVTQSQRKRFTASLLTTTMLEEYLNHLDKRGQAPRTRRKALAILKVFCRFILSEGLLKYDPSSAITRPKVVEVAPRELTADQRRILKVLVEQQESTRMIAIFALGYWAGLRVSEVAELRVGQCVINQRAGEITIIDSKGQKTRTLDLPNRARLALYRVKKFSVPFLAFWSLLYKPQKRTVSEFLTGIRRHGMGNDVSNDGFNVNQYRDAGELEATIEISVLPGYRRDMSE